MENNEITIKTGKLSEITKDGFITDAVNELNDYLSKWYLTTKTPLKEVIDVKKIIERQTFKPAITQAYENIFEENKPSLMELLKLTPSDFSFLPFVQNETVTDLLTEYLRKHDERFFELLSPLDLICFCSSLDQDENSKLGHLEQLTTELKALEQLTIAPTTERSIIGTQTNERILFSLLSIADNENKLKQMVTDISRRRNIQASINKSELSLKETDTNQISINEYWNVTLQTDAERQFDGVTVPTRRKLIYFLKIHNYKPQLLTYIESNIYQALRNTTDNGVYITDKELCTVGIYKYPNKARQALESITEPLSEIGIKLIETRTDNNKTVDRIARINIFRTRYIGEKTIAKELGFGNNPGLFIDLTTLRETGLFNAPNYVIMPDFFYSLDETAFIIAKLGITEINNNPSSIKRRITVGHVLAEIGTPEIEQLKRHRNASRIVTDLLKALDDINRNAKKHGYGINFALVSPDKKSNEDILRNGRIEITITDETKETLSIISKQKHRGAISGDKKQKKKTTTKRNKTTTTTTTTPTIPLEM